MDSCNTHTRKAFLTLVGIAMLTRREKSIAIRPCRSGFTLLEVVLALALSAIILVIVASGIRLHLKMVDAKRLDVEQTELARAVLRQITRDLESTVLPPPQPAVGGATDDGTGDNGELGGGPSGEQGAGSETTGSETSAADESAAGEAIDPDQQTAIGLYGTLDSIRFESTSAVATESLWQALDPALLEQSSPSRSELQTLSYFLDVPQSGSVASAFSGSATSNLDRVFSTNNTTSSGSATNRRLTLNRLAMDYSAHGYAVQNGGAMTARFNALPLADEVTCLQFRYFDGLQWLNEWDSTAQGGLPVAVEVTIGLFPSGAADENRMVDRVTDSSLAGSTFSTIVRLPVGKMTFDFEAEY